MKSNKLIAVLLAFSMLLTMLQTSLYAAENSTEENSILIKSYDDLIAIAANATSDSWSKGKLFLLESDITLEGKEFFAIPIMDGSFDGQGHTISGIKFDNQGAESGFFRRIGENGSVKNLNVIGEFELSDESEQIGGIVGKNLGMIENCSFSGRVSGGTEIGGICGINEASGIIINCTAKAKVSGFHRIGGICGKNSGLIKNSISHSEVNTSYHVLESAVFGKDLLSADTWIDITDVGGIVGFSDGKIESCQNFGSVGYIHVGYNIGGIVGRQNGNVYDCKNSGDILGRRDVGGICGKLEPLGFWSTAESYAVKLDRQLNEVKRSLTDVIDEFDRTSDEAGDRFGDIIDVIGNTEDSADLMLSALEDFINGNIDEANELFSNISDAADEISDALDKLEKFSDGLSVGFDEIEAALEALDSAIDSADPALDEFSEAADHIGEASDDASRAMKKARNAVSRLRESVGDREAVKGALTELAGGLSDLSVALKSISDALNNSSDSSPSDGNVIEDIREYFDSLRNTISKVANGIDKAVLAISDMTDALGTITREFDIERFDDALIALRDSFSGLADATEEISVASDHLSKGIKRLEDTGDEFKSCTEKLEASSDSFSDAFDSLTEFIDSISEIIDKYKEKKPSFEKLGDNFSDSKTALKSNLDKLNEALDSLENTVDDSKISERINSAGDSIYTLTNIMTDMLADLESIGESQDSLEDISDLSNIGNGRKGSVENCENTADISGDTDIGGIVGSVSLDISIDRENTVGIAQVISGGAKYLVSAYVSGSVNSGFINSSADYVGGIVGRGDFGVISNCISSGAIESDGNYAGGIAGKLDGSISTSSSRALVSGNSYIGGIAGSAVNLIECLSLSEPIADGLYCGSIAGFIEDSGRVRGNLYHGSEIGGINGFDLSGKCERTDFDSIAERTAHSEYITMVTLDFTDENDDTTTITIPYGLRPNKLPDISDNGTERWKWDMPDGGFTTDTRIAGEYVSRNYTLTDGSEVPHILVYGVFDDDALLSISEYTPSDDSSISKHTLVDSSKITVTGSDLSNPLEVHLRAETGGRLYITSKNGKIERCNYKEFGSYIVFEISSGDAYSYYKVASNAVLIIISIAAGICVLIVIIIVAIKRRKKASQK